MRIHGALNRSGEKTFTEALIADIISRTSRLLLVLFAYSSDIKDTRDPGAGEGIQPGTGNRRPDQTDSDTYIQVPVKGERFRGIKG